MNTYPTHRISILDYRKTLAADRNHHPMDQNEDLAALHAYKPRAQAGRRCALAGAAMALSSVSVLGNALLLKRWTPKNLQAPGAEKKHEHR